ncbi:MAG: hypothetical protein KDH09_04600 [Chrysiogenetes bacterium]|nr:hypothetical protein [Chrysiogenetes bacterium]
MSEEQNTPTPEQKEELDLYERLAKETRKAFEKASKKSAEALDESLAFARKEIDRAGEFSKEQLDKAEIFLKRDLEETAGDFERLGDKASELLHPSRLGAGLLDLSTQLLNNASDALKKLASRADSARTYHSGEITGPGTLVCKGCGKEIHLKATGHIPPCSGCAKTEFSKKY